VLNWNGRKFLGECLESVLLQTFDSFEVIVVDNGSTDGSVEYVRSHFLSIRVIENGTNLGFAAGNNVGIKASNGRYVVLLNNDTRVSKDFLKSLVQVAQADRRIGSVGCGIVQEDHSIKYGPVFLTRSGVILGIGEVTQLRGKNGKGHLVDCLANCGCAVLYSKSALDRVGLFDEDFWSDWEDHDLGYRLALAGYRNVFIPAGQVLHKGGGSFGSPYSLQRIIRITRNSLATYFKNFEAKNILLKFIPLFLVIIPLKQALNPIMYEFSILNFRFSRRKVDHGEIRTLRRSYGGWFRGCVAFLRIMPLIARKRTEIQGKRNTADSKIREVQQVKISRTLRPPAL
jgi:GT2 family glycosyltransferase